MNLLQVIYEEVLTVCRNNSKEYTLFDILQHNSLYAVLGYRLSHMLYMNKHYFGAKLVSYKIYKKTNVYIHPCAEIGRGLFIVKGQGVYIGENVVIKEDVILYNDVVLRGGERSDDGRLVVGNNVLIGMGAKIIGTVKIIDGSQIGIESVIDEYTNYGINRKTDIC